MWGAGRGGGGCTRACAAEVGRVVRGALHCPGVTRGVPLSMKSTVTDNNDRSYNLELGQDASALVWALLVRFAGGATPGWVERAGDIQTPVILPGWYHYCGVGVGTGGAVDSWEQDFFLAPSSWQATIVIIVIISWSAGYMLGDLTGCHWNWGPK